MTRARRYRRRRHQTQGLYRTIMRLRLSQIPTLLGLLALGLLLAAQIRFPNAMSWARHLVFDAYIAAGPAVTDAPVTVVSIDEASLTREGPWPWPPARLAALVDRTRNLGASIVALALIPSERGDGAVTAADPNAASPTPPAQPANPLAVSLARLPSVMGFALTHSGGSTLHPPRHAGLATVGERDLRLPGRLPASLLPPAQALELAAGAGALNVFPDPDGRLRRLPLLVQMGDALYPSLAAEVFRLRLGAGSYLVRAQRGQAAETPIALKIGDRTIRLNGNGEVWLHFAPRAALPRISASWVLRDEAEDDALHGRIAIIGVEAAGIGTAIASPLGERLAPAEIHAQALAQLMSGLHPWRPAWAAGAELTVAAAGGLLLIGIALWRRGLWLVVTGAGMVGSVIAAGYLLFSTQRLLLDPLAPAITITVVYVVLALSSYLISEHERRWIQRAFASYLSPALLHHLTRHPEQLKLGGERRECSFIMTDLAGFTPLVEQSEPEALVDLLNRYLDRLLEVIFAHQGTLDRIVGDAVSVRFSAPVHQPDHAQRAVDCALALDHAAHAFATEMRQAGVPFGETRIGVHTGEVIVGNFGGSRHLDYRAFGDAINTAARLETANKVVGTRIIVSADTCERCSTPVPMRPIGDLLLKGKARPVTALTPLSAHERASDLARDYERVYRAMQRLQPNARALLETYAARFPDDPLLCFHRERLRAGEQGTAFSVGL
jgi:adenylate cyclase